MELIENKNRVNCINECLPASGQFYRFYKRYYELSVGLSCP